MAATEDRDWLRAAEEELTRGLRALGLAMQEASDGIEGAEAKVRALRQGVEILGEIVGGESG